MQTLGFVGNFANIALFAGPLAAIQTVLRERSTQSMSLGFTCAVTLNCLLWSLYGFVLLNDPQIYASNFVGLLLAIAQLMLFARFGLR